MILKIDGNINRYYVQTLCMVFFPGSTFGENEEPRDGVPEITVSVYPDGEVGETAYVSSLTTEFPRLRKQFFIPKR